MTFLKKLWNSWLTPKTETNEQEQVKVPVTPNTTPEPLQPTPNIDAFSKPFDYPADDDLDSLQIDTVIANLRALKGLISQPKEEKPELRFSKIQAHLGIPECYETIRQERWHINIHCPDCQSTHLKQLAQIMPQSVYNHRYRCLDCGAIFNDDTGTPIAKEIPPLNAWMQCWYLMGCTESLIYIANKLGLDLPTVEHMAQQLQKTFNAKQPLTRFVGFTEWHKQSHALRAQLKEDLLKQYEKLNANVATQPTDTAEFRRQESLRRDPSMKTPTGTKNVRTR